LVFSANFWPTFSLTGKCDYTGNVMKNRNGFVVESELRQVSSTAEHETEKER